MRRRLLPARRQVDDPFGGRVRAGDLAGDAAFVHDVDPDGGRQQVSERDVNRRDRSRDP